MPPRHRFLEPIHNVKEGQQPHASAAEAAKIWSSSLEKFGDRYSASAEAAVGGARRDRTDDLKLAKLALSQLSYGPSFARLAASFGGQAHWSSMRLACQPKLRSSVGWWAE